MRHYDVPHCAPRLHRRFDVNAAVETAVPGKSGIALHRMPPFFPAAVGIAALGAPLSDAADTALNPGLYRVEVHVSLPNVQDSVAPGLTTRCIDADGLRSGRAFFVLSDNPLRSCDLLDYEVHDSTATYRISCPGPNRGSAVALFETTRNAYRGTIRMNMGGKNMTMAETQSARRIGDCR